ncbi:DUF3558 family protein [Haloactinomyces albus]|uniref:DUF3558 domain-containing protein n=1 Tax=Haloactinomyces albus TaxID=1352928 RepID=A0AAE3ZCF6_9ACTN|nr:DUF3558 family protein [Haloactinomyces albus]MDR7300569.1 hypothetical protein [Haloactinomyces albus]
MSVWSRSLMVLAAGVALVGASGCSAGGAVEGPSTETSAPSASQSLQKVDPCKMLAPQDLKDFGLEGPGSPNTTLPWEPGCDYSRGDPITATVYKNMRQTVESAAKKPSWAMFKRIEVNGRSGAQAITKGATQARICSTMFNAGKGLIEVSVSESELPDDLDECAKSTEIAKRIEPEMPEPA